jgi:hypothetical protein
MKSTAATPAAASEVEPAEREARLAIVIQDLRLMAQDLLRHCNDVDGLLAKERSEKEDQALRILAPIAKKTDAQMRETALEKYLRRERRGLQKTSEYLMLTSDDPERPGVLWTMLRLVKEFRANDPLAKSRKDDQAAKAEELADRVLRTCLNPGSPEFRERIQEVVEEQRAAGEATSSCPGCAQRVALLAPVCPTCETALRWQPNPRLVDETIDGAGAPVPPAPPERPANISSALAHVFWHHAPTWSSEETQGEIRAWLIQQDNHACGLAEKPAAVSDFAQKLLELKKDLRTEMLKHFKGPPSLRRKSRTARTSPS